MFVVSKFQQDTKIDSDFIFQLVGNIINSKHQAKTRIKFLPKQDPIRKLTKKWPQDLINRQTISLYKENRINGRISKRHVYITKITSLNQRFRLVLKNNEKNLVGYPKRQDKKNRFY